MNDSSRFPYSPVAVGRYEIEAAVYPVVLNVAPVQPALVLEVLIELVVDILLADPVALLTVERISETCRASKE